MFGATKSINTMVIDPIQYLDLVNKLEEDAYRGIVDCDFFKIFKSEYLRPYLELDNGFGIRDYVATFFKSY